MKGFRDAMNAYGFQDLGFSSSKFTWCNMQECSNKVYLRLDRAFSDSEWISIFKDTRDHRGKWKASMML